MASASSSGKVTRMASKDVKTRKVPNWLLEMARSRTKQKK